MIKGDPKAPCLVVLQHREGVKTSPTERCVWGGEARSQAPCGTTLLQQRACAQIKLGIISVDQITENYAAEESLPKTTDDTRHPSDSSMTTLDDRGRAGSQFPQNPNQGGQEHGNGQHPPEQS